MKYSFRIFAGGLTAAFLIASTVGTGAFALLGPVQPWMQAGNGVILPGDIGGPMDIGSGYRWNVPVVTYGFDPSFLDFFGSNGVAAVESAIRILNDLPPASNIVLTNFPFGTQNYNSTADMQGLYDLKSQTLALLLEQLGLAQPTRNVFVLKQWSTIAQQDAESYFISPDQPLLQENWQDWAIPDFVVMRNFDPQTLTASQYVNGNIYTAFIASWDTPTPRLSVFSPSEPAFSAVADFVGYNLNTGEVFTGLTFEDVGGLCYLLSTNTVNFETLLPAITGVGANSNSFVNGAWRPGVDKITFVPQPVDLLSSAYLPMTNCFTDTFITNGNTFQQQVQRVITQPDILFSVADTRKGNVNAPTFWRTGTTNWINNASANGNIGGEGPGVIQPPVQICFNKSGLMCVSFGSQNEDENVGSGELNWGSFDGSTNAPIIYPIPQTGTNQMMVRMWLEMRASSVSFEWTPTSAIGTRYMFQTTTNMLTWANLFAVTNDGTICTYLNYYPASPSRFYRLIQQ